MTFTMQWQIECPPTTAFDLFADIRNEARWNDGVKHAEMLTAEPVGPGSKFVTSHGWPLGDIESTITSFQRPQRLEVRATSKAMDLAFTATFTQTGSGTSIHAEFDPAPNGVMKVLLPLLLPMIRRDIDKQHQHFKALCESEAHSLER